MIQEAHGRDPLRFFIGGSEMEDQIQVLDGAVPVELQAQLSELLSGPIWQYGWKSNKNHDRYGFWHAHFAGGGIEHREDCEQELLSCVGIKPVQDLWALLSTSLLKGHEPLRIYANGHTYGVEGYIHQDNVDMENYFTTICYANKEWRGNWGGETQFFSGDVSEIVKSVLPKPGRLVSFPGHIYHRANGPTRDCPELRQCVVIKTQLKEDRRHTDCVNFLLTRGADKLEHTGRPFIAHLVGTERILKQWGCAPGVQLAGLFHSIYGTETFTQGIVPLSARETIRNLAGVTAEHLANLFCTSYRPFKLDGTIVDRFSGVLTVLDKQTQCDLVTIEAANLIEQGSHSFWLGRVSQMSICSPDINAHIAAYVRSL